MTENVSPFVSALFLITSFATVLIFAYAIRLVADRSLWAKVLLIALPFWMLFHAALALGGFHSVVSSVPPRMMATGPIPAAVFGIILLAAGRNTFVPALSLRILTIIHVIRIPVELVLHWLAEAGAIPAAMTFRGWNFDILSGITAPLVYFLAFRGEQPNRPLLIAWNVGALALLAVIVTTAVLAFPGPTQQIALDSPNRAVAFFPWVWLPTVIVPIVFFCHLASLYKLLTNRLS